MAVCRHGNTPFTYETVELYRNQPLGKGSYGMVCKAKCDKLPCAAKLLHPIFFQSNDPGSQNTVARFEMECDFLSSIRHPNIVQYLGTYRDPETGLPVLLMELMDESLTSFLHRTTSSLPLRTQVNLCHDIALALAYLHSRDMIHRDLSSNNILLIAGSRAKVTDFGMSKLIDTQSHFTPLTQCPGCPVYMAPEALLVPPQYSKKLDCFSFGVLGIQIITRSFPSPGPRMITVQDQRSPIGVIQIPVSEVERRKNDLDLVSLGHAMKPLLLECLQDDSMSRPSSGQVCDRLVALKGSMCTSSHQELQTGVQDNLGDEAKERQIQNLQHQVEQLQVQLQLKEVQLAEVRTPQRASHTSENSSDGSESQYRFSREASAAAYDKRTQRSDIPAASIQLKWKHHKDAPAQMVRGSVVVDPAKNMAYFNSYNSDMICSYDVTASRWDQRLLKCPRIHFTLAIIDGLLTAVGGFKQPARFVESLSHHLCCFKAGKWSVDIFPPMPTEKCEPAAASFREWLVVAGGKQGTLSLPAQCLIDVEVLNSSTKQWSLATPLPKPPESISMAVCGHEVYVLGSFHDTHRGITRMAFSMSLVGVTTPWLSNPWGPLTNTNHFEPTCVSFKDSLLAIGGKGTVIGQPKSDVYRYDPSTKSWVHISDLLEPRHFNLVAVLPNDTLLVVGGATKIMWSIMSVLLRTGSTVVEIGELC